MKLLTVLIGPKRQLNFRFIDTSKNRVFRRIEFFSKNRSFEESSISKWRVFRRILNFGESTKLSWGCSSSSIFFQSFKTGTFGASSSFRRFGSFVRPFEGWRFWFFFSFISSRDLFGGWRSSVSESRLKNSSVSGHKIPVFENSKESIVFADRKFRQINDKSNSTNRILRRIGFFDELYF